MTRIIYYKEQLECVERELKQRHRVYSRAVANGKMSQKFADLEIARMQAVYDSISKLYRKELLI